VPVVNDRPDRAFGKSRRYLDAPLNKGEKEDVEDRHNTTRRYARRTA